ncbi:MAG: DMT family transporter [Candidatus Diapherotrites archaeon]|uniref:DMT family transporter n=1 Tax=Candidatus Iainarchaeum sp. TaxID=3101447 RepID=A0A8T4LAF7_9ARCH|nr:DMT family transporter [Candidatus Diapherotrites archaeon]
MAGPNPRLGTLLVLITALSSGIAIFLNKYSIASFDNAFVFTFLKNALVAAVLLGFIFLFHKRKTLESMRLKEWGALILIGLIGGAAAFAIYFYALKTANGLAAGLLHKTLFVWAGALAVIALKEKIDKRFLVAAGLIVTGNLLLFSGNLSFGLSEGLILVAVLLWAVENMLAKRLLNQNQHLDGLTVGFGRMFFGALFLFGLLVFTGDVSGIGSLSFDHWQWIALTGLFLVVYVATYYVGLEHIPLHQAAALLAFGQPVTAVLTFFFVGKTPLLPEAVGLLLLVLGTLFIALASFWNQSHSQPVLAG